MDICIYICICIYSLSRSPSPTLSPHPYIYIDIYAVGKIWRANTAYFVSLSTSSPYFCVQIHVWYPEGPP